MNAEYDDIRVHGKTVKVPKTEIDGRTVIVSGRWLKIAAVKDEELVEGSLVAAPAEFISHLRTSGLRADLFTFAEGLGASTPKQQFPYEWDNAAVVDTTDLTAWWEGLPQEARKNARRAAKKGVVIKTATLDEGFATGIKRIYDETPVRQGRPFWHYGKDLARVILENGTYLERSEFIGAYHNGELIGFMKWVYVDNIARILQILSLNSQHDKRPMNALIVKAVEICHQKRLTALVYGRFTYGNNADSTLTEFKRRMGFEQVNFIRYYVPLTLRGRLALKLGIHRGLTGMLPSWVIVRLLALRSRWFGRFHKHKSGVPVPADRVEASD